MTVAWPGSAKGRPGRSSGRRLRVRYRTASVGAFRLDVEALDFLYRLNPGLSGGPVAVYDPLELTVFRILG